MSVVVDVVRVESEGGESEVNDFSSRVAKPVWFINTNSASKNFGILRMIAMKTGGRM